MINYTKLEEELNQIKYNGAGIGSLLALELFLLSSKTYKKKNFKGYLVFIKIILKAFLTKIPVFENKTMLYYKSGDKNHYNKIFSTFKNESSKIIITGESKDVILKSPVFYLRFKYLLQLVLWVFKYSKRFNKLLFKNRIKKNKFSLFLDLIINILRLNYWLEFYQLNRIKLLVGDYDRRNTSAPIFLSAKINNIDSIVIQHGVINPPYGYTPILADYVFVWGEMQKKQYISLGIEEERIKVTGTPIISKIKFKKRRGHIDRKNIILAVNPILDKYIIKQINDFCELSTVDKYNLYIKIHPSQTVDKINKFINNKSVNVLPKDIKFSDFVKMCDVLVTHNSGLANECILNDIPVIILDNLPISAGNGLELNKFCNVPLVYDAKELIEKIKKIENEVISKKPLYNKTGSEAKAEIRDQVLKILG